MMETISLDPHWRCNAFDHRLDPPNSVRTVASLAVFDTRTIGGQQALLEREFDLPAQDECVNYLLEIDTVPVGTHFTLNGRDFGELTEPLSLDVTDLVALEDNRIAFRVPHNAAGHFGAVRLIAVPCDS
jgi:hypothetical protein